MDGAQPGPTAPYPGKAAGSSHADKPAPAEELVWVGRTSWKHFGLLVGLWAGGSLVLAILLGWMASRIEALSGTVAFWIAAVPILIGAVLVAARIIPRIYGRRYRLTSQRLFIDRGLFSQTIDQTELVRVDDVRVRKTVLDRVFGLGTVEILSTDLTDKSLTIDGVTDADTVAEAVRNSMRSLRKDSVYVESL